MRRDALLWCALSATMGCAAPRQMPPPESAAVSAVERGVLGFVADGDTTVIEEYTRTAATLEGLVRPQVSGAKFGWARYRVEFGASGEAQRTVLELGGGADPRAAPTRTWTVTIGGGEVVDVPSVGAARRVRVAGSVTPVFAPSMAMFHEVIRRAHRQGGGRTEVLVYPLATTADVHAVTVEWPAPDTAAVSYQGARPQFYAVDPRGRVLRSTNTGGRYVVRLR